MNKNLHNVFIPSALSAKPLFILEMANNHMGDVKHGLKIIRNFHQITKKFNFNFAFKFQYRHINTFIHPEYKNRTDIKCVKRFSEIGLKPAEFLTLKKEAQKLGYITIYTIGLGIKTVSFSRRVPSPPARITIFIYNFT